MNSRMKSRDGAVSPVVGVMLMLVVTIIIAAVVSAFAGGMGKTTDKAPSVSIETHIVNDGSWGGSGIDFAVMGSSEAIPTKNIKIITDWKSANGTSGGNTVYGPNITANTITNVGTKFYHSPLGFGPGVEKWATSGTFYPEQHYGNYSLMANTHMHSSAFGSMNTGTPPSGALAKGGYGVDPSTRWTYTDGSAWSSVTDKDGMMAILGNNWHVLRPGDIVHVKMIHTPSGKVIYDARVTVEG